MRRSPGLVVVDKASCRDCVASNLGPVADSHLDVAVVGMLRAVLHHNQTVEEGMGCEIVAGDLISLWTCTAIDCQTYWRRVSSTAVWRLSWSAVV